MQNLLSQSAVSMVARLAAHAITALELAELHIAQIERLNPELNALVDFDADRVRTQARKLDAMPASERGCYTDCR